DRDQGVLEGVDDGEAAPVEDCGLAGGQDDVARIVLLGDPDDPLDGRHLSTEGVVAAVHSAGLKGDRLEGEGGQHGVVSICMRSAHSLQYRRTPESALKLGIGAYP